MTKYIETIYDITTGQTIVKELSPEATKERDAAIAAHSIELAAYEKQSAQAATDKAALLAKLGITADEAKLLLS